MKNNIEATTKGHLLSLDALRGIAATAVALGHIGWVTSASGSLFFHNVYLFVDFFFVLSGFVIALNYSRRIQDVASLGRFVWLRFWRLYPLHLFMLLVFLGIESMKWYAAHRVGLVSTQPPFETNNGWAFFTNLLLIQSFGLNANDTFNSPAWSISTEFYTYLIFALVAISFRKRYAIGAAILVVISAVLIVRSGGSLSRSHDILALNRCIFGFFVGVLAFTAYDRIPHKPDAAKASWPSVISIMLLLALIFAKRAVWLDALTPILSAGVIYSLAISGQSNVARALSSRPMLWFGAASYSIYMVHMAVIWFFDQAIRLLLHAGTVTVWKDQAALLAINPLLGNAFAVAAIAVTLLASNFTFKWIEAPMRDWSKRAWPRSASR